MTAQQTADVIANAREAVAKGNADYLERTIVALADERDGLRAVVDAAAEFEKAMDGVDCHCRDQKCIPFMAALRKAGVR